MIRPVCPHCNNLTRLVSGMINMPRHPDLKHKRFYYCRDCDAYTGCKRDGTPIGTPADIHTRKARQSLRGLIGDRTELLEELAHTMRMKPENCQIELLTEIQCLRAMRILKKWSPGY